MKDHLMIDDADSYAYRIVWYLAEEQDYGAVLGEGGVHPTREDLEKIEDFEDRTTALCDIVAGESSGVQHDDKGYCWESRSAAQTALRSCNAAMKQLASGKPWPEWAMKAKAAGWKPPKGWKP